MSADVHAIETPLVQAERDVVELLEELLEQARAGEITAIAIAQVNRDETINSRWSSTISVGKLLGAIALMQYRFAEAL